MSHPTWDMELSLSQFKKILKHPRDGRFRLLMARTLSRVPFYEVFHQFMTPRQFKRHYPHVRRLIDADLLGAGRIEFWDWLYRRIR